MVNCENQVRIANESAFVPVYCSSNVKELAAKYRSRSVFAVLAAANSVLLHV